MGELLWLLPLTAAVGAGWWLGRREQRQARHQKLHQQFSKAYFDGLTQLIDNDADQAINSFIEALRHDTETVSLRLALGTLFRKRGEIQRATQVHQEILAYPALTAAESLQVQLALAEDYLAAGWHDRAETLLLGILNHKNHSSRSRAARLLISLYELEKEWQKALNLAAELKDGNGINVALAHYCCELAEIAMAAEDEKTARSRLKRALEYDPCCVRASLLTARWELRQQNWKGAVKSLLKVEEQSPRYVPETVSDLVVCYQAMDDETGLRRALTRLMEVAPSASVLLALVDLIAKDQGDYQAACYITDQLKRRPTVKGFNRLIDFQLQRADGVARDSLTVLRGLSGQLLQSKPGYRCSQCGFSGKRLHWLCPSCRRWNTVAPIQGLEGE